MESRFQRAALKSANLWRDHSNNTRAALVRRADLGIYSAARIEATTYALLSARPQTCDVRYLQLYLNKRGSAVYTLLLDYVHVNIWN